MPPQSALGFAYAKVKPRLAKFAANCALQAEFNSAFRFAALPVADCEFVWFAVAVGAEV